jgi:hypothetical protein
LKKYAVLLSIALTLTGTTLLFPQERGLGLGIIIGEPTGFSGKYWLNDDNAVDFGLGYSFVHPHNALSIHGDYMFHLPSLIKSELNLPVYYGFGGRVHLSSSDVPYIGTRGVIGIEWIPANLPIDTFLEIAPVFNIFAQTSLHLDMAFGCRYYLK